MSKNQKPKSPSLPLLIGVYVALILLLGLTIAAAHAPLGALALVISLVIAAAKAVLVILVFMHVRYSTRVTWLFVGVGFLWLTILFSLTFAEYFGRAHLTRAPAAATTSVPLIVALIFMKCWGGL